MIKYSGKSDLAPHTVHHYERLASYFASLYSAKASYNAWSAGENAALLMPADFSKTQIAMFSKAVGSTWYDNYWNQNHDPYDMGLNILSIASAALIAEPLGFVFTTASIGLMLLRDTDFDALFHGDFENAFFAEKKYPREKVVLTGAVFSDWNNNGIADDGLLGVLPELVNVKIERQLQHDNSDFIYTDKNIVADIRTNKLGSWSVYYDAGSNPYYDAMLNHNGAISHNGDVDRNDFIHNLGYKEYLVVTQTFNFNGHEIVKQVRLDQATGYEMVEIGQPLDIPLPDFLGAITYQLQDSDKTIAGLGVEVALGVVVEYGDGAVEFFEAVSGITNSYGAFYFDTTFAEFELLSSRYQETKIAGVGDVHLAYFINNKDPYMSGAIGSDLFYSDDVQYFSQKQINGDNIDFYRQGYFRTLSEVDVFDRAFSHDVQDNFTLNTGSVMSGQIWLEMDDDEFYKTFGDYFFSDLTVSLSVAGEKIAAFTTDELGRYYFSEALLQDYVGQQYELSISGFSIANESVDLKDVLFSSVERRHADHDDWSWSTHEINDDNEIVFSGVLENKMEHHDWQLATHAQDLSVSLFVDANLNGIKEAEEVWMSGDWSATLASERKDYGGQVSSNNQVTFENIRPFFKNNELMNQYQLTVDFDQEQYWAVDPVDVVIAAGQEQRVEVAVKPVRNISGSIWHDYNLNGVDDDGDVLPHASVKVSLFDDSGHLVSSMVTKSAYEFRVLPGNYRVDYEIVTNAYRDKAHFINGNEQTLQVDVWQNSVVIDPLAVQHPRQIAGNVWLDDDGDGLWSDGRDDIADLTVELWQNGSKLQETLTTANNGSGFDYVFEGLGVGIYDVIFNIPDNMAVTRKNSFNRGLIEDDAEKVEGKNQAKVTVEIDHAYSYPATHAPFIVEANAGFYFTETPPPPINKVTIAGRTWNDAVSAGEVDGYQLWESSLNYVKVHLQNADGLILASTTTEALLQDGGNDYAFFDVPEGDYRVVFELPNNKTTTIYKNSSEFAKTSFDSDVLISADGLTTYADVIVNSSTNELVEIDAGFVNKGDFDNSNLRFTFYYDKDGDGERGENERTIVKNVEFNEMKLNGENKPFFPVISDRGYIDIMASQPGTYSIEVDLSQVTVGSDAELLFDNLVVENRYNEIHEIMQAVEDVRLGAEGELVFEGQYNQKDNFEL